MQPPVIQHHHADGKTIFALAHEFPSLDAARRTFSRIEAKAKRMPISAVTCTLDGRAMVVLLADEEKDILTIIRRVAFGGKPFTIADGALRHFYLRREQQAIEAILAGRVRDGLTDQRASYDPRSPPVLGPDGRLRRSR